MPFDPSGNFNRKFGPTGWQDDRDVGIKIRADRHDEHDEDIGDALSEVILRDGRSQIAANIPWGDHKITSLGYPTDADDAASKRYVDDASQPVDPTLTALAALDATPGFIEQTGADTFEKRKAGVPIGTVLDFVGAVPPSGWLLLFGQTIGSASSAATYAADGYEDLFILLWTSMANAQAPVSGGRGVGAQADWDANKTIQLPDARGRVIAGQDDMGGGSANRLTAAAAGGVNGDVLGNAAGDETTTLTVAQMPAHGHPLGVMNAPSADGNGQAVRRAVSGSGNANGIVDNTGGGEPHNNVQPTLILNKIIYTGV